MLFFFVQLYLICHGLNLDELIIFALLCHELIGSSEFCYSALIYDNYFVRLLERG